MPIKTINISADVPAPEGLTGIRTDGDALSMIWQSQSGCYNLNHLGNLRTMNMAFGNDGKEMIGANLFTPEDLAPYAGKYITSVSALINYFNYDEDVLGINATAVIFEDGKIVREQKFEEIVNNGYSVVNLDEPLLIDGNATRYIDNGSYDNAAYQVSAMTKEGQISELSAPFVNKHAGMLPVLVENGAVNYDIDSNTVSAGEDASRISVIDAEGRLYRSVCGNRLSVDGLCPGLYVVVMEYADRIRSSKLIIR